MKKFLSILMVLAMVLSLSVTVLADEANGSITITNATIDETYAIYKIFNATISTDTDGKTEAVSYSIEEDSQFFDDLFNDPNNIYFTYNENTGSVTKKEGVNDSDLTQFLTKLVNDNTYTPAADPIVATDDTVVFSGLDYGYYLITSSLGSTVTINSSAPHAQVIDKNQKPGSNFNKQVQIGVDDEGNRLWDVSNSANIGDKVTYRISFEATNYDGDKKIKYYQIHDEKGDAIWTEFESFEVYVDGEKLERGYYLALGGENTDNWQYFGNWEGVEANRNNAQWYLVHLDYDEYRITIPWLTNHTIQDVTDSEGNIVSYSLNFANDATPKFDSPADVEIIYDAVVEANASIGDTSRGNRYNKAYASWTSENETGATTPKEVVTKVYGIGLLKDDIATSLNLAGAKFRIYRDKDCTIPVYVIPTDIDGVYIVDSLGTYIDEVTGIKKDTTRELYADYLAAYLGQNTRDNYVVSQINGKLAILGLKEGSYFLKEVEAPNGYNALTQPVELKAGEETRPFIIYADENGKVADLQNTDGVHTEHTYNLTHTVVHNSKGVVLPATGGEGTFWLITIGTLLTIGFAVVLITHKKMSVYTD